VVTSLCAAALRPKYMGTIAPDQEESRAPTSIARYSRQKQLHQRPSHRTPEAVPAAQLDPPYAAAPDPPYAAAVAGRKRSILNGSQHGRRRVVRRRLPRRQHPTSQRSTLVWHGAVGE